MSPFARFIQIVNYAMAVSDENESPVEVHVTEHQQGKFTGFANALPLRTELVV
jgi:hypothetical protein